MHATKLLLISFCLVALQHLGLAQDTLQLHYDDSIEELPAFSDPNMVSVAFPLDIPVQQSENYLDTKQTGIRAFMIQNPGTRAVRLIFDGTERLLGPGDKAYFPLKERASRTLYVSNPEGGVLKIIKVYVDKSDIKHENRNFGFGSDLPCQIDIHCPEGLPYSLESKSVVRIWMLLEEGIGYCSGSFVNNTAEDKRPFILSAFHCIDGYTPVWDEWEFDIGFESYLCGQISHQPGDYTFQGCTYLAGDQTSDFMLLELDEGVGDLPVSFLGWNRAPDYRPDTVAMIHHPQGDLKKVSLNVDGINTNPNQIFWSNDVVSPPHSHLMCHLDHGSFEGGSSGAPLIDNKGHILGQLHGGRASCTEFLTFAGRLSLSWNGPTSANRLKDWLDPLNTGVTQLDVLNQGPVGKWATVSGSVKNGGDVAIANTRVAVKGTILVDTTDRSGNFSFEYFQNGGSDTLLAFKNDDHLNGVNVLDVVILRKYLLGFQDYSQQFQFIASDVNKDGSINVLDFVAIRKLILGFIDSFNDEAPWFFFNENGNIDDTNLNNLLLRGHKVGDLDNSATPDN